MRLGVVALLPVLAACLSKPPYEGKLADGGPDFPPDGDIIDGAGSCAFPGVPAMIRFQGTLLRNDQSPVAGVTVSVEGESASDVTDANGIWTLPTLPTGGAPLVKTVRYA